MNATVMVRPRGSRPSAPYAPSWMRNDRSLMPVSSASSRTTAASSGSFIRMNPPGSAQRPLYGGDLRSTSSTCNARSASRSSTQSTVTIGRG